VNAGAGTRIGPGGVVVDNRFAMPTTVLIVDDHPGFRASARRLLEDEGYEVVGEAADGADALRATRELEPDVILLDVRLPDLDGFAVSRRITGAHDGNANPEVILISSREVDEWEGAATEVGARGFIPKAKLSRLTMEELLT
jgi:DNA-binding NarL/FixJ family response regulator